jgi:hypothetical protein
MVKFQNATKICPELVVAFQLPDSKRGMEPERPLSFEHHQICLTMSRVWWLSKPSPRYPSELVVGWRDTTPLNRMTASTNVHYLVVYFELQRTSCRI